MKKVFRVHPLLVVEGRLCCLLFVIGPLFIYYFGIVSVIENPGIPSVILCCAVFAMFISFQIVGLPFLWINSFQKLVLTDEFVEWRCLFYKTRRLNISEIRYANVVAFTEGNAVNIDLYNTGFLSILLSSELLPTIRIDKIKCSDTLIKFSCSHQICIALAELLPAPLNQIFENQARQYEYSKEQSRKRRQKRKQRKAREKERRKSKKAKR